MDPTDSYHAHQQFRQVYVVIRVDEGSSPAAPLASRLAVLKIHRRYEDAQREVEKLNASGKGLHLWQVGRLSPDDGPAEPPPADDPARVRAERDGLREELRRARGS